jgi:DNA-binding CsgD family transcriptional regulator
VRPEPSQRNVALDISEILSASRLVTVPPVVTEVYSRYGLGSDANMRVLVCEGPSLLAWIGVFQAGAILPRQRRIMTRLIAPMRRRFSVERLLSTGVGSAVLLLAALEEISAPAFVTDEQGVVLEANRVGTEWLAGDRLHKRRMLRDVVCVGGLARVGFRVTRVASPGAAVRFLVVGGRTESSDHRIRVAAREWRLSPRETQILTLLCDGLTTRTLAAQLGVSERTVGAHLTSMFEKAQVESRAELVVQALRRPLS